MTVQNCRYSVFTENVETCFFNEDYVCMSAGILFCCFVLYVFEGLYSVFDTMYAKIQGLIV